MPDRKITRQDLESWIGDYGRHREERSDEAIQGGRVRLLDCFAFASLRLAMTALPGLPPVL